MAPATDELSAAGSAKYDSETMTVGDGTWDFSKNTFLLPNLQGLNFDTMRYNGMGNRFSTVTQYHSLIIAHAVMAAIIFLFLIPFSVMTARFYANRPGWAVKYHAQMNILAGMMLLAVFLLGYFAVGPERSLTNPHHGIGVAIFVMFILQMVGGRLIRHITKSRSLRIMIHQWSGRAIALLGIAQVPLGLTLYGSPKYLFILYAVWMSFLFVLYFILSYQSEGRREFYMSGARSARTETTRTRVTESEYFASEHRTENEGGGKGKWLGPLAAGAGLWALTRGRDKNRDRSRSRSRSRSANRTRTDITPSRRGSTSYLTDKYSELPPPKKSGGGFMKILGGAAAAIGAGKIVSGLMSKREDRHDEEYSAIATETPRRERSYRGDRSSYRGDRSSYRGDQTETDFVSEVTETTRRDVPRTRTSLPPPPRMATATFTKSDLGSRMSSEPPTTPRRATQPNKRFSRRSFEESDYSSYVSPSRRPIEERKTGGGLGGGFLGGLGMGWIAKKLADRRAAKEEQRLRDEEDLRSGTSVTPSRFTGDGYVTPTRRGSRRPIPARRQTAYASDTVLSSQAMTETSFSSRPPRGNYIPATEVSTLPASTLPLSTIPPSTMPPSTMPPSTMPPSTMAPSTMHGSSLPATSMPTIIPVADPYAADPYDSRSRPDPEHLTMPAMPPDPAGILAGRVGESETSDISPGSRPHRTRQGRAPMTAAGLATESDLLPPEGGVRYSSPASLSMKLKVHDDRERNVTLRRLTEEEAARARSRKESETEIEFESPTGNRRRRYRRDSSQQRRAESGAERRAEEDELLEHWSPPPPNPAFAKGRKTKDSAYYSGQPQATGGPAGSGLPPNTGGLLPSATLPPNTPMGVQTISSIGSMGESHGTWSAASPSPPGPDRTTPAGSAAADNRRRRRLERRRASESKPTGADMYD